MQNEDNSKKANFHKARHIGQIFESLMDDFQDYRAILRFYWPAFKDAYLYL